ncbi:unnamed protein product [Schistosoma margrebowiei]|uniref:GYF domain-containing protein n=2 Tax=Schistosoma margrebowiei TaxID=48269 RepID=A0AA84ZIP4_9TREM|nr:unnamed protein product [Schistosoma margrebowiei]
MTAQPESFQFSPQWIRELSDDAFNSRRQPSHSPTEGRVSSKSPNLFSNFVQKHSNFSVPGDKRKGSLLNSLTVSLLDTVVGKVSKLVWPGDTICAPSVAETDSQGQPSTEVTKQYSHCIQFSDSIYGQKSNANQVINPASHCVDTNKQAMQWTQKSSIISPSEPCWQLHSDSGIETSVNKVSDTIGLNTTGHSLPSSSARPLEVQHVGGSLLSGNSSVVSNPTLNINSILPNDGIPVPRSDPYSHNNNDSYNNQSKRAVSAYYGINDPDKTLDSSVNSNAIWMQQHIWSKSVPQHLHGFNPIDSTSNSVSNFCGVAATETNRHSSCSVPDAENIHGFFSQLSSFDRLVQSNSSQAYPLSNSSVQHPPNILSAEKGFVRRNGSDQSDEHMWLYEDPQGRTQGTFSDAQMNEWLMAGIYFTPNLRIRRQCDDTFSTLASYTQLFERVPFVSGPRIPPIRGEINQAMLALSSSGFLSKPHFKNSDNPPTDLLPCNSTNHDQSEGSRVNASMVGNSTIDTSRSLLSEPQHQLYQQLSDFSTSASNATTSVPTCQVTEEGLNTTNSRSLAYGPINTSVPVSVPMSLLNNSINNLRIRDNAEADFKSVLDNPNNLQQHKQAISSASTFMNLTSLIPLNSSFPSFNLQFPSRLQGTNGTTMDDLTSAASSFLSPGFWSVLTQYLNLHPPSANQTSTPMQQLAETAQLAAQLAALVGSHSPDQTPMQPSQALALAQLLITRGVGLGSFSAEAPSSNGLLTSKKDKPSDNECIASSSIFHTSEISAVSERHQESQTQWPSLGSTLNQSAPHCSEGRFNPAPLNKVSSELSYGKNCEKDLSVNTSAVSQNIHSCRPNYLDKPQSTLSKPSTSPRPTNVKSKIQPDSTLSEPTQSISLDGYNRTQQNGRGPKNTEVCSGGSVRSTEQKQTAISSSRTGSTNQSRVKGSKSNNVRSPTKAVVQNNSLSSQVSSSVNIRPTEAACTSVASNSETDPDQTVEDELKKLTQWCQSRLGSMPMREKVDIPTVVELLATLDAPYEVERMVQTFLGETARTAQFVKDFLDRRRPFWQLHRKRREQENTIQESSGQNSNQPTSTVRSTEKKKRTNPNDTATNNTQRQNSSICNGLSWNKSDSTHLSNIEQIQDNQWHHIKPKGSHNRKSKKDKST